MHKTEFRKKYTNKRNLISENQIEDWSLEIANQCLKLNIWHLEFYHIFMSIPTKKEINTEYLLNILQGKDKNILIPRSDFKTIEIKNILLTDSTIFEISPYGIPEPKNGIEISPDKINVIFIPLLAFDCNGNRIGYGKGFYDRLLEKCSVNTIKIGLSFFEAEEKPLPNNSNDQSLDYCVTPKNIYQF